MESGSLGRVKSISGLPFRHSRSLLILPGSSLAQITLDISGMFKVLRSSRQWKGTRVLFGLWRYPNNGARLATGSEDYTARVWSMETGLELVTIREHRGAIWSIAFSPDDRHVISGSYDFTISISNASTGENLHILSGHTSVVEAIAYSPRGNIVASGAADGTIKLWDGKNGTSIAEMKGHADKIKCLKFSPNSDDLFSSSDDGTVRIWSTVNVLRVL